MKLWPPVSVSEGAIFVPWCWALIFTVASMCLMAELITWWTSI